MMKNTQEKNEGNKELTILEQFIIDVLTKEGPMTEEQLVQRCKEIIGLELFEDDEELEEEMTNAEPVEYAESYAAQRTSQNTAFFAYKSQIMNIFDPWVKVKSLKGAKPAKPANDLEKDAFITWIKNTLSVHCKIEEGIIDPGNLYDILVEVRSKIVEFEKEIEKAKMQKFNLIISNIFQACFSIIKEFYKNKANAKTAFKDIWTDLQTCYINVLQEMYQYFSSKQSTNQAVDMIKFLLIAKKYASYFDRYISDILNLSKFTAIPRPYLLRGKINDKLNEADFWTDLNISASNKQNPPKSWEELAEFLKELNFFSSFEIVVPNIGAAQLPIDDIKIIFDASQDMLSELFSSINANKTSYSAEKNKIIDLIKQMLNISKQYYILFKSSPALTQYESLLLAFLNQFIQISIKYIDSKNKANNKIPYYLSENIYNGLNKIDDIFDIEKIIIPSLSLKTLASVLKIDNNIQQAIESAINNLSKIITTRTHNSQQMFTKEQYRIKALSIVFKRLNGQISFLINTVSKNIPNSPILNNANKLLQWLDIDMAQYIDYLDEGLLPFTKETILKLLKNLADRIQPIIDQDTDKKMTVLSSIQNQIFNLRSMLILLFETQLKTHDPNSDYGLFYTYNLLKLIRSILKDIVPDIQTINKFLHPRKVSIQITPKIIKQSDPSKKINLKTASFDEIISHKFYLTEHTIYGDSASNKAKDFILIPPTPDDVRFMQETLLRSIRLRQLYLQNDQRPYNKYIKSNNLSGLSANQLKSQTDAIEELKTQRTIAYQVFNILKNFSDTCLANPNNQSEEVINMAEKIHDAMTSDSFQEAKKTIRWAIHQFINEKDSGDKMVYFPVLGLTNSGKIKPVITAFESFLDFNGDSLLGLFKKSPSKIPDFTYNGQTIEYSTFGPLEVCQIHMKENDKKVELAIVIKLNKNDLGLEKALVFVQHLVFKKGKEGVFLPIIEEIRTKGSIDKNNPNDHFRFLNYVMHYGKENNNDSNRLISQPILSLRDGGRLNLIIKIKMDKAFISFKDIAQSIGFDPGIRGNTFGVYLNPMPVPYGTNQNLNQTPAAQFNINQHIQNLNPAVWGYNGVAAQIDGIEKQLDDIIKQCKSKIASIELKQRELRSKLALKLTKSGFGYNTLNENTDIIRNRIAFRTIKQLLLLKSYFERISNLHDYISKYIYHTMKKVLNAVESSTGTTRSTRIVVEDNRSLHADAYKFSKEQNRSLSDFERGFSRRLILNYFSTCALVYQAPSPYTSTRCSHCGSFADKGFISFNGSSFKFEKNRSGNLVKCRNDKCDLAKLFSYFNTFINLNTKKLTVDGKIPEELGFKRYLSPVKLESQNNNYGWLTNNDKEIIHSTVFYLDRDANASHNFARFLPFQNKIFSELLNTGYLIRKYYKTADKQKLITLDRLLFKMYDSIMGKDNKTTIYHVFDENKTFYFEWNPTANTCTQKANNDVSFDTFDTLINRLYEKQLMNSIKTVFTLRKKIHTFFSTWIGFSKDDTCRLLFKDELIKSPEDLFMLIAYGLGPP